jgi:hypothetical protein
VPLEFTGGNLDGVLAHFQGMLFHISCIIHEIREIAILLGKWAHTRLSGAALQRHSVALMAGGQHRRAVPQQTGQEVPSGQSSLQRRQVAIPTNRFRPRH